VNEIRSRTTHGLRGLVTSIVDGAPVSGGHTLPSTNPARLEEVVGEVSFGDASIVVRAAESAKKAQEEWAAIPAPIRGRAIARIGRLI
jgi:alpha-ketoglutaric semialdehyde dehydrogenase